MTRKIVLCIGFATALACAASGASAQDKASRTFITKAVEGNLAEVQMGQLAQEKGNSDGVRSFGQMLQQDHGAAAERSRAVATQMGATPPTEPNKKHKALHDKLAKLSGDQFDKMFASEMVKDHKKDIADYKKAAKKQNDPAGTYASETLPTLERHLEMAQSLNGGGKKR